MVEDLREIANMKRWRKMKNICKMLKAQEHQKTILKTIP